MLKFNQTFFNRIQLIVVFFCIMYFKIINWIYSNVEIFADKYILENENGEEVLIVIIQKILNE